jgi:hypothetical protein
MATSPGPDDRETERRHDWDLLVRACRADVAGLGAAVAARLPARRAGEWAGFLRLMEHQGTGPLAASALLSVDAGLIPEDVRAVLRERVQVGALRASLLIGELVAILDALEARGVDVIAHKGPALSMLAYGRLEVRDSVDLDLVVREKDVSAAEEALRERGYRRHELQPLSPRQEAAWRRTWNEYEFISDDGWLFVDLHWRVCPPRYPFRVDARRLWSREARTALGGREVRVFPAETLVVLLCLHGAKDRWHKLIWLCDVDRLIRACPSLDWGEILAFADEGHCRRAVGLGLLLAQRLLGAPLPNLVLERFAGHEAAPLAVRVEDRLAAGGIRRSWRWEHFDLWPFHLEVFDGWRDRARYLARTLLIPRGWDWQRVPLPDSLYPLHYLLRPPRLLVALARKSVRRQKGRPISE